jgi:hypothetical protein
MPPGRKVKSKNHHAGVPGLATSAAAADEDAHVVGHPIKYGPHQMQGRVRTLSEPSSRPLLERTHGRQLAVILLSSNSISLQLHRQALPQS